MSVSRTSLGLLAAAGLAFAAPAAFAAPNRTVTLAADLAQPVKYDWAGATATALNTSYFVAGESGGRVAASCGSSPHDLCDLTLVHVTGEGVGDGEIKFRIDGFENRSDFDLRLYESNAQGERVSDITDPKGDGNGITPLATFFGDWETTTLPVTNYVDFEDPELRLDDWFLVEVPYFTVVNDDFAGHVTLSALPPAS